MDATIGEKAAKVSTTTSAKCCHLQRRQTNPRPQIGNHSEHVLEKSPLCVDHPNSLAKVCSQRTYLSTSCGPSSGDSRLSSASLVSDGGVSCWFGSIRRPVKIRAGSTLKKELVGFRFLWHVGYSEFSVPEWIGPNKPGLFMYH